MELESFQFDDILKFSQSSYLLKTQNSETQKRIISSVFRDGGLLYSRHQSYNGSLDNEQLFEKVREYHNATKGKVEALFKFSSKCEDSKDLGKRILLVRAFMKNKMLEEAAQEINRLFRINPKLSVLYFYLGEIYLTVGNNEDAIQCFQRAIQIDSKYADYYFFLGKAHFKIDKCGAAINAFAAAVKLNGYYSEAYYYLGLSYLRNALVKENFDFAKHVHPNARNFFEKAAQLNPDLKTEAFQKGEEALSQKQIQEAYDWFSELPRDTGRDKGNELVLDFYIRYLGSDDGLGADKVQAYIDKLQAILKKFAGYADLHHELGIAYMILAKCISRKAMDSFQRALEINPNYSEAQRMLSALENQTVNLV